MPWTMMELSLHAQISVLHPLLQRRLAIFIFGSDISTSVGWQVGSVDLMNVKDCWACGIFLELTGFISKVICSLLLRTCLKEKVTACTGGTNFGGKAGSMPANQEHENSTVQSFWNHMICHIGIWHSNQSSHLTFGTFGIPEKLLDLVGHIRHLHEMILIEPTDVPIGEMTGNS
jgi:hypothetical protein